MNTIKIAVLMNDISGINPKKDSSLAILLEADNRGWETYTFDTFDLFARKHQIFANIAKTKVTDDFNNWFTKEASKIVNLKEFNIILIRKDPPFNMDYIYATYLLELAQNQGVLIFNKPQSLRDVNEKLFALNFTHCIPKTLVSANEKQIKNFIKEQQIAIVKPLDSMGGNDIFKLNYIDDNINEILDYLTKKGHRQIMVQEFLKEIVKGDKRILIIDGKPIEYALARVPKKNSFKGNLAAGAIGIGQPLSNRDIYLCQQIAPTLKSKGLIFVGLDVIGDYITEINVTSPTCIRELDAIFNLNIAGKLLDVIEQKINKQQAH